MRISRMKTDAKAGRADDVGVDILVDSGFECGGRNQFRVPGTGVEEGQFFESGGLHARGYFLQAGEGGLGLDAEERVRVGREAEAQRGQHEQRQPGRDRFDGGAQNGGADHFLGVQRQAHAMIGESMNREHDEGVVFFGAGLQFAPCLKGPG